MSTENGIKDLKLCVKINEIKKTKAKKLPRTIAKP